MSAVTRIVNKKSQQAAKEIVIVEVLTRQDRSRHTDGKKLTEAQKDAKDSDAHTIVDAARETGETRVESEKNVEKKGLVQ